MIRLFAGAVQILYTCSHGIYVILSQKKQFFFFSWRSLWKSDFDNLLIFFVRWARVCGCVRCFGLPLYQFSVLNTNNLVRWLKRSDNTMPLQESACVYSITCWAVFVFVLRDRSRTMCGWLVKWTHKRRFDD